MISKDLLKESCAKYGITITDEMAGRFDAYAGMLVDWNSRVNLTAITDPDEIVYKHFLDSLLCLTAKNVSCETKIVDIGTGAGFPGIPLLIYENKASLTMIDGNNKRIRFLDFVLNELGLKAETIHGRAEDIGRKTEYRESYDLSFARAVSHLRELSEYCIPFLKLGGSFIAMKGSSIKDELNEAGRAISEMGGKLAEVHTVILPNENTRNLVEIEKVAPTPDKYPRPSAKMAKKPIV